MVVLRLSRSTFCSRAHFRDTQPFGYQLQQPLLVRHVTLKLLLPKFAAPYF